MASFRRRARRQAAQGRGIDRRQWLAWAAAAGAGSLLPAGCSPPPGEAVEARHDTPLRFPGKVPMRALNDRPPCLETPWTYFRHDLTPNEAFYVRWHLQFIPTRVDSAAWRLKVGGHVERPLELSLADLHALRLAEVVAVNQCSGNSRGLVVPHVTGAQWGNGAMGNARWTGVPLGDCLRPECRVFRMGADILFDCELRGPRGASEPGQEPSLARVC
jgi:DMSO/TMAO reductase YedYZ molybdopterin-dependent catalytic subunit